MSTINRGCGTLRDRCDQKTTGCDRYILILRQLRPQVRLADIVNAEMYGNPFSLYRQSNFMCNLEDLYDVRILQLPLAISLVTN